MTLRETAQQALEEWHTDPGSVRMASLMIALRAALAKPEREPDTALLRQALVALKQIAILVEYGTPDALTAQQVTDIRFEINKIARAAITSLRECLKEKA